MFTADFDQIELRIIAALANETAMIEAAKKGESLHKLAAVRLFGANYVPDQYKLAKNINFTYAFAGGAETMSQRYEITFAQAIALIRDYEIAFPALAKYKRRKTESILQSALSTAEYKTYKALRSRMFNFRRDTPEGREARAGIQMELKRLCYGKVGYIYTNFGRRIIVNAEKPYAAINYEVQTSAADVLKEAFLRVMDDEELNPTVLLPIHDELLGQALIEEAEYFASRYAEVMTTRFMGVPITASGKVYGKSWGHGYKKKD
jgi:DNA polymerase-1